MTVYAIWPSFVAIGLVMLLACLPVFDRAGFGPARGRRIDAVDGLRGFLALAVVLHHSIIYYEFMRNGAWAVPPSRFYTLAGQLGVAYFFVITGYLFWGKIVRARGSLDFASLMLGRLFRLGPVYLLVASIAMAIMFVRSGARLNVPAPQFFMELVQNLSLGIFPLVEINGAPGIGTLTAGVTWTLQYEWLFYFALPFLAIFARRDRLHLPFAVLATMLALIFALISPDRQFALYSLFGFGMVCASLEDESLVLRLHPAFASIGIAAILAVIGMNYETSYRPDVSVLIGASFYLMLSGGTLFGLLVARPSIRLGEISYCIYLMQGLALFSIFAIPPLRAFALAADAYYWIMICVVMVVLVLAALAAHVLVERPGIELGRRIQRRERDSVAAAGERQPQVQRNAERPVGESLATMESAIK
ncbi:acyltransferase [Phyllobacterium sp. BT25]|uniref:Acyltransferase n=1 Tax=Phyllobacterium pellucidum TaxID=2740464 RepID=A0A849VX18_9HYPH|nr:acyltransferase [Phyllobacterium pellucidum]NTS32817.1 acyltransferase [Phyllobacterium pellucidum]